MTDVDPYRSAMLARKAARRSKGDRLVEAAIVFFIVWTMTLLLLILLLVLP